MEIPSHCTLCPRQCGADRAAGQTGLCGGGAVVRAARAGLHFWEEPCISGTRGSGTVFFSGCALRCVFCQNEKISHGGFGRTITPEQLSAGFQSLIDQGAHNINLVNPTHFLHVLDRILPENPRVPVIFNTGGTEVDGREQLQFTFGGPGADAGREDRAVGRRDPGAGSPGREVRSGHAER